jgi:phospho-N-acetylmuramoyl-pentapeptide-transferase
VPLSEIVAAFAEMSPAAMRGVVHALPGGGTLIDDSYNSNPWALEQALQAAASLAGDRRWAVLGDMLELGPEAPRFHREAGARAAALGFSPVAAVGPLAASWPPAPAPPVAPSPMPRGGDLGAGRAAAGRPGPGQGLARHQARAGGRGAPRRGGGERRLMLYHLLFPLHDRFAVFNVVRYITFRAAAAALTRVAALASSRAALHRHAAPAVGRPEHPRRGTGEPPDQGRHADHGRAADLSAVLVPTLLWANLENAYVWLVSLTTLAFGAIGFADDYLKVKRRRNLGLTARSKFLLQVLVAALAGAVLAYGLPQGYGFAPTLTFPFFKDLVVNLGVLYIPFVAFILVGSSNAVNLTDGLDGLAIGATLVAAATYTIFSYVAGNSRLAGYLQVAYVPGVGEVTVFCAALVGAALGFLWWNAHPAQVFMGDVGSLAIGGAIGGVAVLAKQEILLGLVGGLFVLEALSVIIQVASSR